MNAGFRKIFTKNQIAAVRRLQLMGNNIKLQRTSGRRMSANSRQTAGILIIGDEILKGHTQDTNSHFLCKELYDLGVKVERVLVIADDLEIIATEVARFSSSYTHVVTSGGIGPTHDDITFEGVAMAFNESIIAHPELVRLCKQYFGDSDDSPSLKMARVPQSTRLVYGLDHKTGKQRPYPLICVRNVYIFPGIPQLLTSSFLSLKNKLFIKSASAYHMREIYLNCTETPIAGILNEFNALHKNSVVLGSYPDVANSYFKVKLTLETDSKESVDKAHSELLRLLPQDRVVDYEKDPVSNSVRRLENLLAAPESELASFVAPSVTIIEEALDRYPLSSMCLAFNGGKDCTALLHLVYAIMKRKFPDRAEPLQVLYIDTKRSFPELDTFLHESVQRYNLKLLRVTGRIKSALGVLQEQHPEIKAVLMGTRMSDPYTDNLSAFTMTDSDWPQFMRINPMLHWTYHDVWVFIRSMCVPYCRLYDKGYTSMGSKEGTDPNPALRYISSRGEVCYHPAYMLQDGTDERTGRKRSTSRTISE
ncbi:FAD synthase-like [Asterias rubens]|uniref:FAD synthase-like n=1 Tax=Asterias rubens TaxID=7604 RepID=UPI00145553F2|nr:FAD synthase-like [Asterias rubens]